MKKKQHNNHAPSHAPTQPPTLPGVPKNLSFAALLATYLTHDPLPTPQELEEMAPLLFSHPALSLFSGPWTDALWMRHRSATVLCHACDGFLKTARRRRKNHHQIAGGKKSKLHFKPHDLLQKRPSATPLTLNLWALCERLARESVLLLSLLRVAQNSYQDDTDYLLWKSAHEAAGRVGLRILQVCAAVVEQTGDPWYAEVCLRWAFRAAWKALFGPTVRLSSEVREWLKPVALPLWRERELLTLMKKEGQSLPGHTNKKPPQPPGPFAQVVAAWQSGDLPEELVSSAPLTSAPGRRVRFWV